MFCILEELICQLELPLSSVLGGLLSRGVDTALIHEKMAGRRDAQSHALCKLNQNNCKQNSPWDLLNVGGTRCFVQAMD